MPGNLQDTDSCAVVAIFMLSGLKRCTSSDCWFELSASKLKATALKLLTGHVASDHVADLLSRTAHQLHPA